MSKANRCFVPTDRYKAHPDTSCHNCKQGAHNRCTGVKKLKHGQGQVKCACRQCAEQRFEQHVPLNTDTMIETVDSVLASVL